MRKIKLLWFLVVVGAALLLAASHVRAQTTAPLVITIEADGPLTPALTGYIERSITSASRRGAELLILRLNTPGGSIDLMNEIVQSIRSSTVPVAVYVAPRGAIAGSAGTLITLAGHVAAMAPDTAIGAASPVGGQGEDLGATIAAKQKEILRATARSLAQARGAEAIALAEDTIENAKAVSAQEALQVGLIDLIAQDPADLITQLDGVTVTLASGTRMLTTQNAVSLPLPMSAIEQLLQLLTNPNILFLLLTIGIQAIFIELSSPGGWVAGFIGAISLLLAIYGLGVLPVNWFGILFLVVAFILFILDIKAPTHGALTVAGAASFVVGSLVLFNGIDALGFPRISVPLVVVTGILMAAAIFTIVSFALRAMREPVRTGMESMIGRGGYAESAMTPRGTVRVGGELWSAVYTGSGEINADTPIVVRGIEGITLIVDKSGRDEAVNIKAAK